MEDQQTISRPSLESVKAKRGRKTNAQIIEEHLKNQAQQAVHPGSSLSSVVLQSKHVEGIAAIPFSAVALAIKEPRWNLSKEDQEFLGPPLADFLNEILPELARKYPKGAILAVCFVSMATKKFAEISAAKVYERPITREEKPAPEQPAAARPVEPEVGADGLTDVERNMRARQTIIAQNAA